MKVSIVTICFNQAAFLEQAIRSVLDQDCGDIEYIVVDPGSTDGSRDIIARYGDRIAAVIDQPDDGPADGLDKGFARATGDVCGYINADDAYLPGAIGGAVAAFRAAPEADVVCAHGYIVDQNGHAIRRFRSDPFDDRRYALGGVTVMQQSTFFRRRAFERVAGFNARNRTSWGGELLLEISCAGSRIVVGHDDWSIFRIHPASISGSQTLIEESRRNWDRYFERVIGRPRRPIDCLSWLWARIEKRLRDPVGLWLRIHDALLGVPQPNRF